jgi:hypothetical protein
MIALALLLAAAPPAAETPRGWMERVYASYSNPDFNPLSHPDRYFAPRLIAAIKEDSRLAHGEVGYVDGDPICQCQDPAGMKPHILGVTRHGASRASVRVLIDWEDNTARKARFDLVRLHGHWRIADVASGDERSFLRAIEAANREARKRH